MVTASWMAGLVALAGCLGGSDPQKDGLEKSAPFYQDADGDTWGDPLVPWWGPVAPSGFVERPGDCDDARAAVHPGADERCDGGDDDCDSLVDDGLPLTETWPDRDGDGWGDGAAGSTWSCAAGAARSGDCDDSRAQVHPDALEVLCDGLDNDCDGVGALPAQAVVEGLEVGSLEDALALAPDDGAVEVCPGAWPHSLEIPAGRRLTLRAWSQPATLEGTGAGPILTLGEGARITLENLLFDGGTSLTPSVWARSGSLRVQGCGFTRSAFAVVVEGDDLDLTVADSTFEGNQEAALYVSAAGVARVEVLDSVFRENQGSAASALTLVALGSSTLQATLEGVSFEENHTTGTPPAALYLVAAGSLDVAMGDVEFLSNGGEGLGGALGAFAEGRLSLSLEGCGFTSNQASHGGAMYLDLGSEGQVALRDCTAEGNVAQVHGGVLLVGGEGSLEVTGGALSRNRAGLSGGALALVGGGEISLQDLTLEANEANAGGALALVESRARLDLRGVALLDNRAAQQAGAIHAVDGACGSRVGLVDSEVSGNHAGWGCPGGLALGQGVDLYLEGVDLDNPGGDLWTSCGGAPVCHEDLGTGLTLTCPAGCCE